VENPKAWSIITPMAELMQNFERTSVTDQRQLPLRLLLIIWIGTDYAAGHAGSVEA